MPFILVLWYRKWNMKNFLFDNYFKMFLKYSRARITPLAWHSATRTLYPTLAYTKRTIRSAKTSWHMPSERSCAKHWSSMVYRISAISHLRYINIILPRNEPILDHLPRGQLQQFVCTYQETPYHTRGSSKGILTPVHWRSHHQRFW